MRKMTMIALILGVLIVLSYTLTAADTSIYAAAKEPVRIKTISQISVTINQNDQFTLPDKINAIMTDKSVRKVSVKWNKPVNTILIGTTTYLGTVQGYSPKVTLTVKVLPIILDVENFKDTVDHNKEYALPGSVRAKMSDGRTQSFPVLWDTKNVDTSKVGVFSVLGRITDYKKDVKAVITVKPYIARVDNIRVVAYVGDTIDFPKTVKAEMSDGTIQEVKIRYNYSLPSTEHYGSYFSTEGIVEGYKEYVRLDWLIKKNREPKLELITERKDVRNIFPSYFIDSPVNVSYEPLDTNRAGTISNILSAELSKYPKKFLDLSLDEVCVFASLNIFGNSVGGTHGDSSVFLIDCTKDSDLRENFHHEFNHILYYQFGTWFDLDGWKAANKAGFSYGNGGTEAITNKSYKNIGLEYSSKDGFVTEYAKSAIEEDIAETSMYLFCGNDEFWAVVDSNTILKEKVRILVNFYNRLDPVFTMKYFRGL